MALTGETLAANRATGAAARKENRSVMKTLIRRYPHFPVLFASINIRSCSLSPARNISGESWFKAAAGVPFADKAPSSIPAGIPAIHRHKISVAIIVLGNTCPSLSADISGMESGLHVLTSFPRNFTIITYKSQRNLKNYKK